MNRLLIFLTLGIGLSTQSPLIKLGSEHDTSSIKSCQGDQYLSCTLVEVDAASFEDGTVTIPEAGHLMVTSTIPTSRSESTQRSKSYALDNNDGHSAIFTARNGNVIGTVNMADGRKFLLEPCSLFSGCHLWKEFDTSKFREDEGVPVSPQDKVIFTDEEIAELKRQGEEKDDTIVYYSVKIYYTIEFAEQTSDIDLFMDQMTAETNQGYINSNIPVRMTAHSLEPAQLHDIEDSSGMLTAFRNYKNSVDELRGGADAATLILYKFEACGRGYVDSWRSGLTLTVVMKSCALGYYSIGHELGHNFGCAHDREHASSSAYSYGYGSYIGSGPYRSILAYTKTGYNKRVNVYSSPTVEYGILLAVAVISVGWTEAGLTCEECTDLANNLCTFATTDDAIRAQVAYLKDVVCDSMPADFHCSIQFEYYWRAIAMEMFNPDKGYWSAGRLCLELNECPKPQVYGAAQGIDCRLCDQALGYHLIMMGGHTDELLLELEKSGICSFLSADIGACKGYLETMVPIALHKLADSSHDVWVPFFCYYPIGCTPSQP